MKSTFTLPKTLPPANVRQSLRQASEQFPIVPQDVLFRLGETPGRLFGALLWLIDGRDLANDFKALSRREAPQFFFDLSERHAGTLPQLPRESNLQIIL
jgi:hypothetical protein